MSLVTVGGSLRGVGSAPYSASKAVTTSAGSRRSSSSVRATAARGSANVLGVSANGTIRRWSMKALVSAKRGTASTSIRPRGGGNASRATNDAVRSFSAVHQ